jgi:hypothetical protein
MTSILKADDIQDSSGNNIIKEASDVITIGASGDTIDIPSGATLDATGATITGALTMTPAFHAYLSANQDISDSTRTKISINTEIYDTGGCYDNSTNYRFTPTTAGKYFVYTSQMLSSTSNTTLKEDQAFIYKNGSEIGQGYFNHAASYYQRIDQPTVSIVVDMNGTSDYLEAWCTISVSSGTPRIWGSSDQYTYFGAYRIIGA